MRNTSANSGLPAPRFSRVRVTRRRIRWRVDKEIERLVKIGARLIVASEAPRKPGIPKKGQPLVAAVALSKADIGDFDTRISRVEVVELFGEEWNPAHRNPSLKKRIGEPKRVFQLLVTDAGEVIVAPHIAAQQKLAGSKKTERKRVALAKNSLEGVKAWKKE